MADEATQTPETTQEAPQVQVQAPEPNLVGEAKRKQREAEKRAEELSERLQELEDKDKSELERERLQRERAEAKLNETTEALTRTQKSSWLRDAATQHNFHDPADAERISLAEIETQADAEKAVKKLADRSKHLVRTEQERPEIGQVVKQGQPVQGQPEQSPEAEEFLNELRAAADSGWKSSPGLLEG